jgi:hypothetical protein
MQAKFKSGELMVGGASYARHFKYAIGEIVNITDTEDHPTYGRRYKVEGYNEWFEENCFDWIK